MVLNVKEDKMAKAKAICKCKYCGNEFEIIAYKYNSRDARDFEKWASDHYDECPECREKRIDAEHDEQARISAEAAKAKGWPELTGSEKQVKWATSIREAELGTAAEEFTRRLKTRHPESYKIAMAAIEQLATTKTKASWWIDNKGYIRTPLNDIIMDMKENPKKETTVVDEPKQPDEVTIAKPEEYTHNGVVDIKAGDNRISAHYPKNEDFRQLVKSLGYRWDGEAWVMSITYATGSAAERAAELGNKLLNAGFAIRIQDANTLRAAIEGRYEPMHQRWIAKNSKTGKFVISWARGDDFYDKAKRLPGARYVSPSIQVPAKEWEAVMDFAQSYDFRFSPGAQELIDEMRGSTVVVKPADSKEAVYDEHPVADILNSSRDIIPDLKD